MVKVVGATLGYVLWPRVNGRIPLELVLVCNADLRTIDAGVKRMAKEFIIRAPDEVG